MSVVQRVVMPVTGAESWTVAGDDGQVVAPAERYLAHLSSLERSPNTVRAYALSLRLWFDFLDQAGVGWADVGVEDVARFVAWLRAPAENVIVLESGTGQRSAATVNRHLVLGVPAGTPCGRENGGWLPADAGSAWWCEPVT